MAGLIDPRDCALVLVDYQARLMPAIHGGRRALANAVRLAAVARRLGLRVVSTEENPAGLGPGDEAIREASDAVLPKRHFDACADGLVGALAKPGASVPGQVVLAGCETHVCLLQTALGLRQAGIATWVVADACGSRRPDDHAAALERLRGSGATVVTMEMAVFEWLRTCDHPAFRDALAIVKATPSP